jgi:hypothetical protein
MDILSKGRLPPPHTSSQTEISTSLDIRSKYHFRPIFSTLYSEAFDIFDIFDIPVLYLTCLSVFGSFCGAEDGKEELCGYCRSYAHITISFPVLFVVSWTDRKGSYIISCILRSRNAQEDCLRQ